MTQNKERWEIVVAEIKKKIIGNGRMDDTARIEIILLLRCQPTIFLYFVFFSLYIYDPHEIKRISVGQSTIVLLTIILIIQFLTFN